MRNNVNPTKRRNARGKVSVAPDSMARWSLLKIIDEAMDPINDYSRSTISNYRRAVRTFQKFVGFEQSAVSVTEAKFAAFRDWMASNNFHSSVIALNLDCLATVVRFADDKLLGSRQVTERKAFADAEILGTLESFMVNEYFPVNARIVSSETKRQYGMAVARFSRFVEHPATLADLSDETMNSWLASMRLEGLRLKSINNYMNYLRAFWSWAFSRGMLATAPTVKNLPVVVEPPRVSAEKSPKTRKSPPVAQRTRAEVKGERDLLAPNGVLKFLSRYLSVRDVSDQYSYNLRKRVIRLAKFAGKAGMADCFNEQIVNDFLASLDLSPYTVCSYRSDLISLWNAADEDIIDSPRLRRIRRPKCPELMIECYTIEEVGKLIEAAGKLSGEYGNGVCKNLYWTAAIRLAWDTGLRRGDVMAFRLSDLRSDGQLRVVQNKTRQIVTVRLRDSTVEALKAIHHERPLEWPIGGTYFGRHFKRLVKASGLNKGSFKWLRRASATYVEMMQAGAGSKHLGHACPQMFDKHYDGHLGGHTLPQPPELLFEL